MGILAAHPFSQNALEVAAVFYVLLVFAFLRVLNYGGWDARPDLAQWQELTPGQAEETMFRRLGDACVEAYLRNRPAAEAKARAFGIVTTALAMEVLALTVAVLIPIIF